MGVLYNILFFLVLFHRVDAQCSFVKFNDQTILVNKNLNTREVKYFPVSLVIPVENNSPQISLMAIKSKEDTIGAILHFLIGYNTFSNHAEILEDSLKKWVEGFTTHGFLNISLDNTPKFSDSNPFWAEIFNSSSCNFSNLGSFLSSKTAFSCRLSKNQFVELNALLNKPILDSNEWILKYHSKVDDIGFSQCQFEIPLLLINFKKALGI